MVGAASCLFAMWLAFAKKKRQARDPAVNDRDVTGMTDTIISRCEARGLRMTGPRRTIARVLQESDDHPDVEELHDRANAQDSGISLATVYRTVKLFEESGIA